MPIIKPHLNYFRNAEHFQFMSSAHAIFVKHNVDPDNIGECYVSFDGCIKAEEQSLAVEKNHEKILQKNEADRYRDRLHSKLFNYVKAITFDDKDTRVAAARLVMKVIREVGNPTHLAENAESAVITTLINRLGACSKEVVDIGADEIALALNEANLQFIALEKECREMVAAQQVSNVLPTNAARKKTDAAYRTVVNAVNGYAGIPSKMEACKNLVAEMNTLITKYNALVAGRDAEDKNETDNTQPGNTPEAE